MEERIAEDVLYVPIGELKSRNEAAILLHCHVSSHEHFLGWDAR